MTVLMDSDLYVHYGYGYLRPTLAIAPALADSTRGQHNGVLGAAVAGSISLLFGLHTGPEPVRIEWHDSRPAIAEYWEDVVEASFTPKTTAYVLSTAQDSREIELATVTPLRVRYCALGLDAARAMNTRSADEPARDRYLLELWPAPISVDAVLKQTSEIARYWHSTVGG